MAESVSCLAASLGGMMVDLKGENVSADKDGN